LTVQIVHSITIIVQGKAVWYWQELLTANRAHSTQKVKTRCASQILSGRLISRATRCSV